MQLRGRHIARNVMFNWLSTIATMAVGFFLSPFIVHRLGNIAYGVWVLAISVVGYLSLLDLGMQSSVLRFVSKGHTQGDHESASDAISAALWVRVQIGVVILVLSGALAALFPYVFKVPPSLAREASIAVMIIGLTSAMTMSVGVLGGVLSGLNRYDIQSKITLAQTAIRVTSIVLVLRSGHGIVAIALCEIVATAFASSLQVYFARKIYPELHIRFRKPSRHVLGQIWSYSFYAFLTTIAVQLVYQTDNLVVGAFISASAVTYYAIGNSLCRYAGQVVSAMSLAFVPAASNYEASGDRSGLRALYVHGTRITLAVSLPILITLVTRGHNFIGLWMGKEYAQISGNVLILLVMSQFLAFANRTAVSIAFGIEKHKQGAIWAVGEGVANLILSVVLVRWMGIYGVAVGTLIPSLFVQMFLWPKYVNELVGVPLSEVLLSVWGPICLASLPFAIASFALGRYMPAHNLLIFVLQTLAILPIFLIASAVVFRNEVRTHILPRVRSFLFAGAQ